MNIGLGLDQWVTLIRKVNKSYLFLSLVLTLLPMARVLAVEGLNSSVQINSKLDRIVIDVRGSRGGKGDVAAGYLFGMDLVENYSLSKQIVFLTESTESSILLSMANGIENFERHFVIKKLSDLNAEDVFDLCIQLANQTGDIRGQDEFRFVRSGGILFRRKPLKGYLNIAEDGVVISQPVIGNTEDFYRNRGTLLYKGAKYALAGPGLKQGQGGVYKDFIAMRLRNMSFNDTLDFVEDSLKTATFLYRSSEDNLKQTIALAKQGVAQIGLVYGISMGQPQLQFYDYLAALLNQTHTKPLVIFTPSSFSLEKFSEVKGAVGKDLEFVTSKEHLPKELVANKVYLVVTENLPHPTFVGLMAASMKNRFVTIGAGDGFMSAAINLGGPFAMTTVPWNAKNVKAFGNLLFELAEKQLGSRLGMFDARKLFLEVFSNHQLVNASVLAKYDQLFLELNNYLPDFAERILNSASKIKETDAAYVSLEKPSDIIDPLLDESISSRILRRTTFNKFRQFFSPKPKSSCVQILNIGLLQGSIN